MVEAKARPAALEKEREALAKELEKCKAKQKEAEAKLKTTLQEKSSVLVQYTIFSSLHLMHVPLRVFLPFGCI